MGDFPIWLKAIIYLLIGSTALALFGGVGFLLQFFETVRDHEGLHSEDSAMCLWDRHRRTRSFC
jgi:hypothetical protein